jgi:mRNA interferase MazF
MVSRDDLWLIDFGEPYPGEPSSHRPAVVLGPPENFGATFPFVIVSPLTTTRRGLSLHVEVEATALSGLDQTSYVQCELIRSVNRRRLVHRFGAIEAAVAAQIADITRALLNY